MGSTCEDSVWVSSDRIPNLLERLFKIQFRKLFGGRVIVLLISGGPFLVGHLRGQLFNRHRALSNLIENFL
jgi:hypothetical protein